MRRVCWHVWRSRHSHWGLTRWVCLTCCPERHVEIHHDGEVTYFAAGGSK